MKSRRPSTEAELVELVRSIDVPAPESLHRSVQSMLESHSARRRGPARAIADLLGAVRVAPRMVAAAGGLAVLVLVLVLALGSGARGGPSVRETAALTLLPATTSPPRKSSDGRAELAASVDGVAFPYWEDALGWRSTGARMDRVGGRPVRTVFYANREGGEVGYAIVSGQPAPHVSGGQAASRNGISFRVLREHGAPVVTWLRAGRLCVVSGRHVSAATLLGLASWQASVAA